MINAKLNDADLQYADLTRANLKGACLVETNLEKTEFNEAILINTDLRGAKDVTIEQLSKAQTLYQAKLDADIEKVLKEKYGKLFEDPDAPFKN